MMFGSVAGISRGGRGGGGGNMMGVLVYRPLKTSPSGSPGAYTFEFEPFDSYPYEKIEVAYRMLTEYAPILRDNLSYYPLPAAMEQYEQDLGKYEDAGLPTFLPADEFADLGFLPLHEAEGYGRLTVMEGKTRPGVRDIVLCPTLPNEMPRVAGIITGVRQTPLSHVNLRAIQDDVPNAFVTGAMELESITSLIGEYVKYSVAADGYSLRAATSADVDAHFAALRPAKTQVPPRDVDVIEIRSLDEMGFEDAASVGVKSANLAALRKLGLPESMVPAGYAVPFSFYDEFMKQNGLYAVATEMMAEEEFRNDAKKRSKALKKFRKRIRKGKMSEAMRHALGVVHSAFGEGVSIRCRSSTNNEDLPGFSGAGLYDSFTHRPDEGPLEKSVQQVFASLWNFRAFEEREFHRIDHAATAMGVLLHPNYSDERANGVAVTEDVVYQTAQQGKRLYYVNAQRGENLVTNPEGVVVPEELLIAPRNPRHDRVLQRSSLAVDGASLLGDAHLLELRRSLRKIDREFRRLYAVSGEEPFAMEVEFKVTRGGDLAIKQARPWVY